MDAPTLQSNLGDCPGSQLSLSFLEVLEVICNALCLFKQYFKLLLSLMELKTR